MRRLEKKTLNEMMKAVRFPLKQRVQDPAHKAYVLLQAAVAKLETKDFSLKVEQAEVVERALRILGALAELAKERCNGRLLESTVLLDRALRIRMWETNYGSVFFQCPGLMEVTKNGLVLRGVRHFGDLVGCSCARVQQMAACSVGEARQLMRFSALMQMAKLSLHAEVRMGQLNIRVDPVVQDNPNFVVDNEEWPVYQLVCYDTKTSQMLCYRKLGTGRTGATFSVPVADGSSMHHIKCILLSNYAGLDDTIGPPTATVSPTVHSTGVRIRNPASDTTVAPAKADPKPKSKKRKAQVSPQNNKISDWMVVKPVEEQLSSEQNEKTEEPKRGEYFAATVDRTDQGLIKHHFSREHSLPVWNPFQPPTQTRVQQRVNPKESFNSVMDSFRYVDPSEENSRLIDCRKTQDKREHQEGFNRKPLKQISSRSAEHTPYSSELDILRRKGDELNLASIPVKRLRTSRTNNGEAYNSKSTQDLVDPQSQPNYYDSYPQAYQQDRENYPPMQEMQEEQVQLSHFFDDAPGENFEFFDHRDTAMGYEKPLVNTFYSEDRQPMNDCHLFEDGVPRVVGQVGDKNNWRVSGELKEKGGNGSKVDDVDSFESIFF